MKRSEAERLISDHLCHYMYEELAQKRAKEVVGILLDAGMLPPYNNNHPHYSSADADAYEWEPEHD